VVNETTLAAVKRSPDERRIARRLKRLSEVFALPQLRSERIAADEVVAYYSQSHDAYRKYHSSEGAVHMALNEDGRFDASGYRGQVRRLLQRWAAAESGAPLAVLELGFGQGYNLELLCQQRPHWRVEGLDLTPAHVALATTRLAAQAHLHPAQPAPLRLHHGDMHAMPLPAAHFDHVFAVEVMCHARDTHQAMAEAARVLKPGGTLTLFDGYVTTPPPSAQAALACELVARGMAIEQLQTPAQMHEAAAAAGLQPLYETMLDAQVMPTLRRLERLTSPLLWWPWFARRALARRALWRGRNLMAGSLMRPAVALGWLGYRELCWRKPAG
jgi:SAM-dependent methyltransferase